jgi:hypothetical protein
MLINVLYGSHSSTQHSIVLLNVLFEDVMTLSAGQTVSYIELLHAPINVNRSVR